MTIKDQAQSIEEIRNIFTPEAIEEMVHRFYARVQKDESLAPYFAAKITNWEHHLQRMVYFWRNILRAERLFVASPRGAPPALHRQLPGVEMQHFHRWLELFEQTNLELFPKFAVDNIMHRAKRMSVVLSAHIHEPTQPKEKEAV